MTDANIEVGIKANLEGGRRVKRTLDDVARSGEKAQRGLKGVDNQMRRTSRTADGFSRIMGRIVAFFGARQIINFADQFALLEARIRNSTRNIEEFEKANARLRDIAKETGTQFGTTVEVFQRISFVRDEINATVEEMAQFTENVQQLGVTSGASTAALDAGLRQLGQGLSSGVLRAEEMNSILENIPSVALAIADEFGVTTGQLRNLVIEGEVLSEDVFSAILNQTQDINEQFEKFPKTIGRAFSAMVLKIQDAIGGFSETTEASDALIVSIDKIGDALVHVIDLLGVATSLMKLGFQNAVIETTGFFLEMGRVIQDTVNLLPGVDAQFASNLTTEDLRLAAEDELQQEFQRAIKGIQRARQSQNKLFGLGPEGADKGLAETEAQTRAIGKNYAEIAEKIGAAGEESEELKKKLDEIARNTDRFAKSAADAFQDFINGSKDAREAISDLIGEIQRLFFQQTVTNPFSDFLKGVFQPGDGSDGILDGIGSFFGGGGGGATPPVPLPKPFATGGDLVLGGNAGIDQNILSLNGTPIARTSLGERATITPASKGGGGGSPTVINQTFNVSTGVQETVQNEIAAFLPTIKDNTIAAMREAEARGRG